MQIGLKFLFAKIIHFSQKKKNFKVFLGKKVVDSEKVRIFAGDNYMLNLNPIRMKKEKKCFKSRENSKQNNNDI